MLRIHRIRASGHARGRSVIKLELKFAIDVTCTCRYSRGLFSLRNLGILFRRMQVTFWTILRVRARE